MWRPSGHNHSGMSGCLQRMALENMTEVVRDLLHTDGSFLLFPSVS